MVFVPGTNIFKVDIRQELFGQQVSNTIYFRADSPPVGEADVAFLAAEVQQFWEEELAPHVVQDLELREIYITDLTTQTSPTYTYPVTPAVSGERTGDPLPSNCTFCVSFRTSGRGRSSRGRNYVAGLVEENVTGNVLDTTAADGIVAAYTDGILNNPDLGGLFTWVVVSSVDNKEPRLSLLVQPVTSVIYADRVIDSQRRRLTNRGR
jgi:hypothetical protein